MTNNLIEKAGPELAARCRGVTKTFGDPRLLVCDEPTSALDHETGHAVMQLLKEMAVVPNRAVLIVTHDPRVFEFGDVIAYMDDGKVIRRERRLNGQLTPIEDVMPENNMVKPYIKNRVTKLSRKGVFN